MYYRGFTLESPPPDAIETTAMIDDRELPVAYSEKPDFSDRIRERPDAGDTGE